MTDPDSALPDPLLCPDTWHYDDSWWNNYVRDSQIDLGSICKHDRAEHKISYFICDLGNGAITKVKTQNLFIKRLSEKRIKPTNIGPHDIDWQSGQTWDYLINYHEELFEIYNAGKAPSDIIARINEVKGLIDAGKAHCEALLTYISNARTADRNLEVEDNNKFTLPSQQERNTTSKWEAIDISHSKALSGFIYMLGNTLMPGIYKIGFTAGNPDKRAKEISSRHALPQPFRVIKYWRTADPYIVEQRIHSALSTYSRQGEFFELDTAMAFETIESHIIHLGADPSLSRK